jgi:hypothetical protein
MPLVSCAMRSRSSLSRSAVSVALRPVMSWVTPLIRVARPEASTVGAAPMTHQRSSPPGRSTRNSAS